MREFSYRESGGLIAVGGYQGTASSTTVEFRLSEYLARVANVGALSHVRAPLLLEAAAPSILDVDGGTARRMSGCAVAASRSCAGNPGSSLPPAAELRPVKSAWTPLPVLRRAAVSRPPHVERPCARDCWLTQHRCAFLPSCRSSRRPRHYGLIGSSPAVALSETMIGIYHCSCRQLVIYLRMNAGVRNRCESHSRAL